MGKGNLGGTERDLTVCVKSAAVIKQTYERFLGAQVDVEAGVGCMPVQHFAEQNV